MGYIQVGTVGKAGVILYADRQQNQGRMVSDGWEQWSSAVCINIEGQPE